MARHDFQCGACGFILRDVEGATPLSAPEHNPRCPKHLYPLGGTRMDWLPAARFSCFSDSGRQGGTSFDKFTLPVEDPGAPGGFREVTVGSLSDIRRLERESEQRERDGTGRRMVWRDYSQDPSNRDQHTIAADPSLKPAKHYTNGTPVKVRRGDPVVAAHGEQHEGPRAGPDTLTGVG